MFLNVNALRDINLLLSITLFLLRCEADKKDVVKCINAVKT